MSESKIFDPKSLDDLLAKVRASASPQRDIDADIFIGVEADIPAGSRVDSEHGMVGWWPPDAPYVPARDVPRYTASVDAALSLMRRALPGWSLQLHAHPGASYATIYRLGEIFHTDGRIQRNVTSPYFEGIRIQDEHVALAICEAILSSLKAST